LFSLLSELTVHQIQPETLKGLTDMSSEIVISIEVHLVLT